MRLIAEEESAYLLVQIAARTYGIELRHVVEVGPPLSIEPLSEAPSFVRGVARIRGEPTLVVCLASLLGDDPGSIRRFVMLRLERGVVALAVADVLGVRSLAEVTLRALPSLAGGVNAERVEAVGHLDAALLVVLRAARLVPEDVFALLPTTQGATT